jgi:TrmH family RNA methyltransferase
VLTPEEQDRLQIVLVNSRNPLNIGAAARAMSNFGFPHLRVVHPYPIAFQEAKSAVDAEAILQSAKQFEQLAGAIADCSLVVGTTGRVHRNPHELLSTLEAAAPTVRANLRSGSRVALLFGSEKVGLSNHELSHCQLLLRIPTRPEHPSMNLGQAVAVVLYELVRVSDPTRPVPTEAAAIPDPPLATAAERERLIALLLEALSFNGFAHRRRPALMEDKVRRLVRHLALTAPDLREWLSLLRQLLWKLRAIKTPPPQD